MSRGDRPIILVGPTAVGKTSVGRALALCLGRPFVDADDLITARAGLTVAEIFRTRGEPWFRRLERSAVSQIIRLGAVVAAVGGGALLDAHVRERVARGGQVVVLDAAPAALVRRLRAQPRPGIGLPVDPVADGEACIQIEKRRASCWSLGPVVDTTAGTPGQAAERAALALGLRHPRIAAPPGWELKLNPGATTSAIFGRPLTLIDGSTAPQWASDWAQGPATGRPRVIVVTSPVPWSLFGRQLAAHLDRAHYRTLTVHLVPDGERAKTPASLVGLWRACAASRVERGDIVIALGGGAVSDLGGLVAATYLRGLSWVVVPTTLLGQVDAAVGGKVAVNLPEGKNLVGAFHQPLAVVVDPAVAACLPRLRRAEGLAEVVKCALIAGGDLWEFLRQHAQALIDGELSALNVAVRRCLEVKAAVVERDERESGLRAMLNLGHTVGHALETAARWPHGRAVAVGLVAACRLARAVAGAGKTGDLAGQVEGLLASFGLPTRLPGPLADVVLQRLAWDKKTRGGKPLFVLPLAPGDVRIGVAVDAGSLGAVVRDLAH